MPNHRRPCRCTEPGIYKRMLLVEISNENGRSVYRERRCRACGGIISTIEQRLLRVPPNPVNQVNKMA